MHNHRGFKITEEPSKDDKGKPVTLFYVRDGAGYQATSLDEAGAIWQADRAADDREKKG